MKLVTTHSILATGQQPHGGKPLCETDGGILKNRPNLYRELLPVMLPSALPDTPIRQKDNILMAAGRTNHTVWPAQGNHKVEAGIFIGEIPDCFCQGLWAIAHIKIIASISWCVKYIITFDNGGLTLE